MVKAIKANHELEVELNSMDTKIGLLVRNSIDLQDVVKQSKKLKRAKARGENMDQFFDKSSEGWLSMTKDGQDRRLKYSQLFYLLQTNPRYLATLVFIEQPLEGWAPAKISNFLQHVIQSTYNFASNARESYLQLQLFRTALKKEITEKVNHAKEFITGNPTVTKLVILHHRGQGFSHYLSDMLAPLVKPLLADEALFLSTDPIEFYQRWLNQTELETGERSELPYDTDVDTALSHKAVADALNHSVQQLVSLANKFLVRLRPVVVACGMARSELKMRSQGKHGSVEWNVLLQRSMP